MGYDKVTQGIHHKFTFNKNNDNDALLKYGNGVSREFVITDLVLWIPKAKPSTKLIAPLEKSLAEGKSVDVHTDLFFWRTQALTGGSNQAYDLNQNGRRLIKAYMASKELTE